MRHERKKLSAQETFNMNRFVRVLEICYNALFKNKATDIIVYSTIVSLNAILEDKKNVLLKITLKLTVNAKEERVPEQGQIVNGSQAFSHYGKQAFKYNKTKQDFQEKDT